MAGEDVVFLARSIRDRIIGLGGVPVTDDLEGATSYSVLFDQLINLLGAGGGAGGGFYTASRPVYVAPTAPGAADDADLDTPFVTIQGALDAIGLPVDIADEKIRYIIVIAAGAYDENLTVPGARHIQLVGLGPVVLGDGAGAFYSSTTPRNITWVPLAAQEFGSNPRPTLAIGCLGGPMVNSYSTHLSYNTGFIVSGDVIIGDGDPDSFTTIEFYMGGCEIAGNIEAGGHLGNINWYAERSRVRGTVTGPTTRLQIASVNEFGGLVDISRVNRATDCRFEGSLTVAAIGSDLPPNAFYRCQILGTFTGPASSARFDAATNYWFKTDGTALAGGATKVIIGDLVP